MSNIKRIKKRNFTATDNQLVRDNRLSWKARGIFNYLWSQSEEWNFYVEEVAKHSKDGIKSLKSGLSELEKHGYLKRTMLHDENGFFKKMSWELSDTGNLTVSTKNGRTDNTVDAKNGRTDNGTLRNNNNKKEQYTSNNNGKKDILSSSPSTVSHAEDYKKIVDYLNQKAGTNYRSTSQKTRRLINARFNEDATVDDFKKVIDIKVSQWKGTEMSKYLRPETLFGNKFEGYLNEQPNNNNQYGASNVDWGW